MFRMEWFLKYKGEVKHLKLKRNPFMFGIGIYKDEKGKMWDIIAIIGKNILARLVDDCPIYRTDDSAGSGSYNIKYIPYTFSVCK